MYILVLLNDPLHSIGKALPQQELSSAKWFMDLNVEAICKLLGQEKEKNRLVSFFMVVCQICISFII
jgi:hypothetical protein